MADNISKSFVGTPIKSLVCDPLLACSESQRQLADSTLAFIQDYAFNPPDKDGNISAKTIQVEVDRLVEGQTEPLKQKMSVPVITLLTIPNLSISDVEVDFTMSVSGSTSSTDESDSSKTDSSTTSGEASVSGSYFGIKASASLSHSRTSTGTVSNKSTQCRQSDQSAKYDVTVKASQLPACEGMAKFSQALVDGMMNPINLEAK